MSNQTAGSAFTSVVQQYLTKLGHHVQTEYPVEIGFTPSHKKSHRFDLGNDRLLVECKSYTWTSGGNNPSGKISTLNEAMLYLHLTPDIFRKLVFLPKTKTKGTLHKETFGEYYVRLNRHMIPDRVEVWEIDDETRDAIKLVG